MSIVVSNCGRSGTNMLLEILRCSPSLTASEHPEDKFVFVRNIRYPVNYLTKCDTVYYKYEDIRNTLKKNKHMNIVWSIRNPKDMVLSKIYRGWKEADDATPVGCIEDMYSAFSMYLNLDREFSDRIKVWYMEMVISDIEHWSKKLCDYYEIEYSPKMLEFYKYMRQREKRRYKCVDKSQIDMWTRWKDLYGGFFAEKGIDVEGLFKSVEPITSYFYYSS